MAQVASTPDPKILDDLVARILRACQPTRIILFGSAARGEMRENSDLDVMIVLPEGADIPAAEEELYRNMRKFGTDFDLVVVTEGNVQRNGNNPCLVIYAALRDGRELYRAAG
ncbi:MAG TPA: nucleotidyltransferase domain-containing protein [Tepidisphaeraceae bacterium]|jgi:predicted nucleotidyltransferase